MASSNSSSAALLVTLGPPPVPIIQDIVAIIDFLILYLDDAAEDAIKLFALLTVWIFSQQIIRVFDLQQKSYTHAMTAILLIAVFPVVDDYSDTIGDAMRPIQTFVGTTSVICSY